MTAALLDVAELATRAGVPDDRVRHYTEVGLLPAAVRDGNQFGHPPALAQTVRLLSAAEGVGIGGGDLGGLSAAWQTRGCGDAQQLLAGALAHRLARVQDDLTRRLRLAAEYGPGTPGWAEETRASVPLTEYAARLQAASAALASAPPHTRACDENCGCAQALTAAGGVYQFPIGPATGDDPLACDLVADGGDAVDRIGVWQQVFTHVLGRDPLADTETGVALRFPLDADLAATLARLSAAEYRCCSFGSYTLVIDHAGLRLEIRMPDAAAGMLAAVIGLPDPPEPQIMEAAGAPDQP
jgi:hypothetical protein